ncbi:hypothetical protein [Roseiconus lacunae]|uniref:Trypsin-like peptidase domain-containing protein n=1 Tax=Roseiconus lacunae TaxID=2605694 RepID=A0ABT7PS35_9BACT|nr:hypothetical protein [Roseiconus lacunae]MDM4019330.1 hypothetical protein [Roseiconus lacunae]
MRLPIIFLLVLLAAHRSVGEVPHDAVVPELSVFRLSWEDAAGVTTQGSAVLLAVDKATEPPTGYWATCYHVLHKAPSFVIESHPNDKILDSASSEMFVWRGRDLVIFRGPVNSEGLIPVLAGDDPVAFLRKGPDAALFADELRLVEPNDEGVAGRAYGFPSIQRLALLPVKVTIWGRQRAKTLNLLDPSRILGSDATNMFVGFLGDEITLPAMSGGLVAAQDGRFAGLVFGRITDMLGMMIPAETVVQALDKALDDDFKPFEQRKAELQIPPPFRDDVNRQLAENSRELVSEITWNSFANWEMAFKADQVQADLFQRFQEVQIPLSMLKDKGDHKEAVLHLLGDDEQSAPGNYTIAFNGEKPKKLTERTSKLKLRRGENLLVISHLGPELNNGRGFSLNSLLNERNRLEVAVNLNDGDSYRITRSLPAVVKNYSIYVTLVNDLAPKEEPPAHDARLAVRLDYLKELLRQTNHTRDLSTAITASGSYVDAVASFNQFDKATYSLLTRDTLHSKTAYTQTVDAEIPITVSVLNGAINQFGLRLPLPKINPKMTLRVRLQALPYGSERVVSVRALAASSADKIAIQIGKVANGPSKDDDQSADDTRSEDENLLEVDVRGLATQLAVAELNRTAFSPDGHRQLLEDVFGVVREVPLDDDQRPRLLAVRLMDDDRGQAWLCFLFDVGSGTHLPLPLQPVEKPGEEIAWQFRASALPARSLPIQYSRVLGGKLAEATLKDVKISAPLIDTIKSIPTKDRSIGDQLRAAFWEATAPAFANGQMQFELSTPPQMPIAVGKEGRLDGLRVSLEKANIQPAKQASAYTVDAEGRLFAASIWSEVLGETLVIEDFDARFRLKTMVQSGTLHEATFELNQMKGRVKAAKEEDPLETDSVRITLTPVNGEFSTEVVPTITKILLHELRDPKR